MSTAKTDTARDAALLEIATRELRVETLETRRSDRLDFHDTAVWSIKAALEAAYEAGRLAERKRRTPTRIDCPACRRTIEIRPLT
jgi:hypothetical protein